MLECKSRGAYLMGLTNYGNYEIEDRRYVRMEKQRMMDTEAFMRIIRKAEEHYPIEIQFNTLFDRQLNNWLTRLPV